MRSVAVKPDVVMTTPSKTARREATTTAAMEAIVPAGASCAESFGYLPDAKIFPEESVLVGHAVEKRRREFATGRTLARRALTALGVQPQPIGLRPTREPCGRPASLGALRTAKGTALP